MQAMAHLAGWFRYRFERIPFIRVRGGRGWIHFDPANPPAAYVAHLHSQAFDTVLMSRAAFDRLPPDMRDSATIRFMTARAPAPAPREVIAEPQPQ